MACGCKTAESVLAPAIIRPSWADPLFAVATGDMEVTDVVFSAAGTFPVAPADPNRWAIGFVRPTLLLAQMTIGPWAEVDKVGIFFPSAGELKWYKLFDFGTMVCEQWFARVDAADSLRVIKLRNV